MNQVQGGGSKVMASARAARSAWPDSPKVTFKDVAGADESSRSAARDQGVPREPEEVPGARRAHPPRVCSCTSRQARARRSSREAVAGEQAALLPRSPGSDFVQMFVSVSASRAQPLRAGERASPTIIFMDEIDAVGRHRGAGLGGGHDEREQTLNQLLVEMDGFEMKDNIILMSRRTGHDILGRAPPAGPHDRQIVVDRPDRLGRRKILEVRTRAASRSRATSTSTRSPPAPGFTGADLSSLLGEYALAAPRQLREDDRRGWLEEGSPSSPGPRRRPGCSRRKGARSRPTTRWAMRSWGTTSKERTNPRAKDHDRLSRPGARPDDLAADGGQVPDDEVDAHGLARHDARRARRRGSSSTR